ncbi:unnamed protein product, partial [Prorocentrum cordatum]
PRRAAPGPGPGARRRGRSSGRGLGSPRGPAGDPTNMSDVWAPLPQSWIDSGFSEQACSYAYDDQTWCARDNDNYLVLCCTPEGMPRQIALAVQCCDTCRTYDRGLDQCGGFDVRTDVWSSWCGQWADSSLVDFSFQSDGAGYRGLMWKCKDGTI